jgi:uncharacterized membrane protein
MKKIFTIAFLLLSFLSYSQSTTVVISQVYGGGGNVGAPYNADFVELHNISNTAQTLTDYSVQYNSATSTSTWAGKAKLPTATIAAGGYYLVQMSAAGVTNGVALPTPDYIANPVIGMSSTNGRVALVSDTTTLSACTITSSIVDLVGYGSSVCFEGTAAVGVLSNTTAAFRNTFGCDDTNNNSADLTVGAPLPRNSASAVAICGSLPTTPTIISTSVSGFGNVTVLTNSVSRSFSITGSNLTGAPGTITITAPSTDFQVSGDNTTWGSTASVPYSSATLPSTLLYVRFTPQTVGLKTGNVTINGGGISVAVTVSLSGTGVDVNPTTSTIVISQVYGAGGNPGSVYNADYVELHNNGTTPQTITNYSVQYYSATGTSTWSGKAKISTATIAAGGYYLVQMSAAGVTNGVALPTPDYVANPAVSMSATNGRVALVSDTILLTACNSTSSILDLVGYGTSICFDGSAAALALDSVHAAFRNNNGCEDTNNNIADFTLGAPAPRNSASPVNVCVTQPTNPTLTATTLSDFGNVVVLTNSASQSFTLSGSNLTGAPGTITVTAPNTDFQVSSDNTTWGSTASVSYTAATLASTLVYVRFTPQTVGLKTGSITINGGGISTAVTVSVSGTGVDVLNPSLSASTVADFGNVVVLTNSTSQSFTLSGSNLTGAPGTITVTAPNTDFQVSSDNTTWGSTASVNYTAATLASTLVYVRFTPQTVGLKTGSITINGGGISTAVTVSVSGTGVDVLNPSLSASTITDFGNVVVLTNSTSQSFTLSGTNLTGAPGTITVTASNTDFQVSSDNTTWGSTASVTYTAATLASTLLYVRFTPQTVGLKTGSVTIDGGGISTAVTVSVSGTGIDVNPSTSAVVISQVYGAGGNGGATYNADYVELHNNGTTPVTLTNYSIQYYSATGTATWSGKSKIPTATIAAGGYYLIQMSSASTTNGVALPTPDYVSVPTISMSAKNGRVALVSDTITLNGCPSTNNIVDLVGYGSATVCFETAPTDTLSILRAAFRNNNGCDDTNNNSADFTIDAPAPRNSASPVNICGNQPTNPTLTATTVNDFGNVVILTNSTAQSFTLRGSNLTAAPGTITVTAPNTDFQVSSDNTTWGSTASVPYTAATLAATLVYVRFTPQTLGLKTGAVTINGGGISTTVNVNVRGTGVAPGTPTLTASAITDFGTIQVATNSNSQTVNLNGSNLTGAPGVLTISASNTDFQVSNDNVTWAVTTTSSYTTASYISSMYVRFTPQSPGLKTGNITISGGGLTSPVTISVVGTGTTCLAGPIILVTGDADSVKNNSAVLNGNIIDIPCSELNEYGFEYSGINGFINGQGTKVVASNYDLTNKNYSFKLNGLVQNSYYYYKAYAKNSNEISYGQQKVFYTAPINSGLVIYSNPLIHSSIVHFSLSGVKPGHYSIQLYNSVGQRVYQKDVITQVNFIDDRFMLPGKIAPGVYTIQIANPEFSILKKILIQ